jgi:serine phosphatase RsbU (regulator of sigma subunit)
VARKYDLVFCLQAVEVKEGSSESTVLGSVDDMSSAHLVSRSGQPARAFEAVLEINRALAGVTDLNEMLGRALDGLMAVFPNAEHGFILTAETDGTLMPRAVRTTAGTGQTPAMSRTVLRHVLDEGKALLIADGKLQESGSILASGIGAAICAPLPGQGGTPVGMVQLDSPDARDGFKPEDLELLAALAIPVGVAVENHRLLKAQESLAAARKIQEALLPQRRPSPPGYTFWEHYRPALEIGGDLYDYIAIGPPGTSGAGDVWAVTVGDVAGKGIPAALLMAGTCPEVRHLVRAGVGPGAVLSGVNRHICDQRLDGRFVTLVVAEIDTRSHRLSIANAGHIDPMVRRAGGQIEPLGAPGAGPPLGIDPEVEYQPETIDLGPGDVVVIVTDGVDDALDRNGQRFGNERFLRVLAEAPEGVCAVGEAIAAAVRDHVAGRSQFDDITIVCFGRDRT